jgi:hypothetical protein
LVPGSSDWREFEGERLFRCEWLKVGVQLLLESRADVFLHELASGLEGGGLVEVDGALSEAPSAPETLEGV